MPLNADRFCRRKPSRAFLSPKRKRALTRSPWTALGFLVLLLLAFYGCKLPFSGDEKTVVRLHDDQIDMLKINNAILEFIIENGYGYPVERVEQTTKEIPRLMARGDVDLSLEMWWDNHPQWFQREVEKKTIVQLGPLYSGRQFWMIPRWVAEQYDIRSVSDMKRYRRLFQDPDDPSKGVFFNCIPGWTCLEINALKLKAYGLDKYYNAASPSSPEALTRIFRNAQLKKVPVFGYYWSPNALFSSYGWQILEEPPYDRECWNALVAAADKVGDDSPKADCACAFGSDRVFKVAGTRLIKEAPDVVLVLKKMRMNIDTLNTLLEKGQEQDMVNWHSASMYFLRNFENQWKKWVTPEAFVNIKAELEKTSSPGI